MTRSISACQVPRPSSLRQCQPPHYQYGIRRADRHPGLTIQCYFVPSEFVIIRYRFAPYGLLLPAYASKCQSDLAARVQNASVGMEASTDRRSIMRNLGWS